MKRLISIFLAFLMMFLSAPFTVFAVQNEDSSELTSGNRPPKEVITLKNYYTDSSKNSLTGKALTHATDAENYLSGDFYDTSGEADLYILRKNKVTGIDTVYLTPTEWVKYDLSMTDGIYDIKVCYDINSKNAVFEVLFLDENGDILVNEAVTFSQNENSMVFNLKEVINRVRIKENYKYVVIKSVSGNCAFESMEFTKEIPLICKNITFTKDEAQNEEIDRFFGLDNLYVSCDITNEALDESSLDIYVVFYSEDGRLLSLKRQNISVSGETNIYPLINVKVENNAAYLKVFSFMYSADICPLSEEKILYLGKDLHYYVDALKGDDTKEGTSQSAPLKTIEKVKERIKEENSKSAGDIYVHLNGEFNINSTLEFDKSDSGKKGFSVIYDGNSNTVFTGGRKIEGFSKVEGTPLYRAKVENASFRQLYVNGNRAQRAKSKWLYYMASEYFENESDKNPSGYYMKKENFEGGFKNPLDMEIVWMPSWRKVRMPLSSFSEDQNGYLIKFPEKYFYAAFMASAPVTLEIPYYIENAPEFLDEPGEWYYNKDSEELFYYPLDGENMDEASVYIPQTEVLLTVSGTENEKAKNITFKGIEFAYGAWNRTTEKGFAALQAEQMMVPSDEAEWESYSMIPAQIQVDYGNNINFIENKFSHLASVALSYDKKSSDCTVLGNVFDDVSASAMTFDSFASKGAKTVEELTSNITVSNNLIRRSSVEYMTPLITAYYVNNLRITHNDLKDAPYSGISLGWGWGDGTKMCRDNMVSYNKIENTMYRLSDGAHIYTLGYMGGTVIENNYMLKTASGDGGIYLDSGTTDILLRNNVIDKSPKWLHITSETVKNNTAVNTYSDTVYKLNNPDQNSIEKEIGKTDGIWCETVWQIINNAGLEETYINLLNEYNLHSEYTLPELIPPLYIEKAGINIPGGLLTDEGGEGKSYHDVNEASPKIYYSFDGTGHSYIMTTAEGEWTKYKFNIPENGEYKLMFDLATIFDNCLANVYIDDELVIENKPVINTGSHLVYKEQEMGTVSLLDGEHTVKIEHAKKYFCIYNLRFVEKNSDIFIRQDGFKEEIIDAIIPQER